MKIAINGFGRIGRHVLRAAIETGNDQLEIIAVNDLAPIETLAHLLKYDSVHGTAAFDVTIENERLVVNGMSIDVCRQASPTDLPWGKMGVDLVMECTGRFVSRTDAAQHIDAPETKHHFTPGILTQRELGSYLRASPGPPKLIYRKIRQAEK